MLADGLWSYATDEPPVTLLTPFSQVPRSDIGDKFKNITKVIRRPFPVSIVDATRISPIIVHFITGQPRPILFRLNMIDSFIINLS